MKANHNDATAAKNQLDVVVNISISKNESKSQRDVDLLPTKVRCGKYQYFKE